MPAEHSSLSNRSRKGHARHDPFARMPATPHVTPSEGEPSLLGILKSALFALPVSLLCGVILLSVMAALALAQPNPSTLITPLSLAVLGLSSSVGGLVCTRRTGHSPALCGMVFGLLFVLITWVLSWIPTALSGGMDTFEPSSLPNAWLVRVGMILLSCLGALAGAKRARRPTHRRSR